MLEQFEHARSSQHQNEKSNIATDVQKQQMTPAVFEEYLKNKIEAMDSKYEKNMRSSKGKRKNYKKI